MVSFNVSQFVSWCLTGKTGLLHSILTTMEKNAKTTALPEIVIGEKWLSIKDVVDIARKQKKAVLNRDPVFAKKIQAGAEFLAKILKEEGVIYGVTTGYGDSCTQEIPKEYVHDLPIHLTRFHGCGLGRFFSEEITAAILAVRLNTLAQGYSGVTYDLLTRLEFFLKEEIYPLIPEEGSVGASGDLTPLSYIAGALIGERMVSHRGKTLPAGEVLKKLGVEPLQLKPKEGLAIMNGTSVMTAVACLAFERAEYLAKLCARITAMASVSLKGNKYHFDEFLFSVKPHPGQIQVASWIRADLDGDTRHAKFSRLQDRYSVRCAPHIIGVLADALPFLKKTIENELNSTNDNPIIDPVEQRIHHGGHFYGGHIAFAMDSLKNCVANLADMLDRQLALLVDVKFNHGLPSNLSGATGSRAAINHGFKAVQIAVSAWTAEALKNTMPASVFSRSTECHNQDKVSMGTIAARDCIRVLELTEQVAAAVLMAVTQGLSLRLNSNEVHKETLSKELLEMQKSVSEVFPFLKEDQPLDTCLRTIVDLIQKEHWKLY
jgi:histidine ammonia-lyase